MLHELAQEIGDKEMGCRMKYIYVLTSVKLNKQREDFDYGQETLLTAIH